MTRVPSILVVEDNPTTRKMLRLALVTEGYAVVEAGDARAALAAAETTLPDLVLQDLILPDMDGLELLRRLRALPGGMELPILALSGFLSRLEEAETDRDGFTALLVKPIEPSRLIDAIHVYLAQRPGLAPSRGEGRRLLVVDDDPVQLKLTRIHFSHLGFQVSVANGAADALLAARSNRPDVILSDVFMPGTDGFDLCLEVRRDPNLASVPVVLVSAQYGSKADEDLASRVGASALVLRTPDFGRVVPAVLEALESHAPSPAEQPSDQLALTHARLVIHQLERQAAATAGLAQRCGIQAGQLSLLSGVADALTRKSDPDVALRDVLAATLDAAGISKGALVLKGESGALELRQDIGFSEPERSKLQNLFGHGALFDDIVRRGGSVSVPSPAIPDDTSHDILSGANVTAAQIVPLISDGRGVGAMIIGATSKDVTNEDSVAFARAMGNQVVQSLELARSVARLTASEQRYRLLLENANDLIATLSLDGVIRQVNRRWVELTGLPEEQLVGRHVRDFVSPGKEDENARTYNEVVSIGAVRATAVAFARADGSSAFIELSSTIVDVEGERLVFTIGRDVTERLQAEAQLRLQSAALNAADNAMVITDREGLIQWVNPAFSDLTGYSAEEAVSRNPRDLIKSDEHDQGFFERMWKTILSGQVWRGEVVNRRKDGSLYAEEQTITPLRDPRGEITHFIDVKQDITARKRADEEIRKGAELSARAEREFRALFAANPLPMWIFDLVTLQFIAVNDAAVEHYGYGRDEFLAMTIKDIRPAEEVERLLVDVSRTRDPSRRAGSWRHRLKSGRIIDVDITSHIITFAEKSAGLVVAQDITERKRVEEEVQQHARLSALTAAVGLALANSDTLAHALQRCAEAVVAHLGAASARIWTLNESDAVLELEASAGIYTHLNGPHERIPVGQFKIGRIARDRKAHLIDNVIGDPEVSDQDWARRENIVTFVGHPLIVDDRVVGVLALFARHPFSHATLSALASVADHVALGIERYRSADALRTTEERMRFALESAGVGIWDQDFTTGVLRWSETIEAHYGVKPGTFAGTFDAFVELVHPDDRASLLEVVGKAMKAGSDFSVLNRSLWPDGTIRWLSGTGRAFLGEHGEPVRAVGISLDVTERHTLEQQFQQAQKMEAVGRLAGGVAHDFNNLLTVILGFCELVLMDFNPGDPHRADIAEIQKAGISAAGLTRQLLAFSRKQIIEPSLLDLNAIATDMRGMLGRLIGEDVTIVLSLEPALPSIMADRGQIEQVVMNLAVNARDAMPRGGTLTIETARVELDENYAMTHAAVTPGHYVALTVTDTGVGMTPEVQARLFEPFFTTKEIGKGTGLGMATVYGIVTRGGGSVGVYSELGAGTSFKVYFPRSDAGEVIVDAPAPTDRSQARTHTVLVVEDEAGLRDLARRLLERQGYTVLVAANATEALQVFEGNQSIDVLLTDVVMPGASGPELTKQLVEQRPALRVIYMSGYTEEAIVQHGVLKSGIAFLNKPFTSDALGAKIREVLER